MIYTLTLLDILCMQHPDWHYAIRNHFKMNTEYYDIDLFTPHLRIVVSATIDNDKVDVWTDAQPSEEDGTRIYLYELQEYINKLI